MDIYSYIHKDHETVNKLFKNIMSAKNSERKKELLQKVKQELLMHAETEHETFYAALSKHKEMKAKIKHADKEHAEVKNYLSKIGRLSVTGQKWLEQFETLKNTVEHHVAEEEDVIFTKAKELLSEDEAIQLAKEMRLLKLKKLKK